MTDQPFPNAVDIEASLIAACLIRPQSVPEIIDDLTADDFYLGRHQLIWKAIKGLNFFKEPMHRTKKPY